jgi:hypothetical protein
MSVIHKVRFAGAVVLLCTMFLPLSQCSRHGDNSAPPTAQALAHSHRLFPQSDNDFDYEYAIKELGFSWKGLLTLVAFGWPLCFVLWSRKFRRSRVWWLFCLIELLLCFGTIYWLTVLTFGGRWLYGGHLASIAVAVYGSGALASLLFGIRRAFAGGADRGEMLTQAWRPL